MIFLFSVTSASQKSASYAKTMISFGIIKKATCHFSSLFEMFCMRHQSHHDQQWSKNSTKICKHKFINRDIALANGVDNYLLIR